MTQFLRRNWLRLLLVCIGIGLLVVALRAAGIAQIVDTLMELSPLDIALLLLVNGVAIGLFTGRWWLFLLAQGYRLPFPRLVGYRLAAFGVSYFTPGPHFGGEPLQVYLVTRRHAVPVEASIAAVTMDKLFELLTNFTFLTVGLAFALQQQILPSSLGVQAVRYALLLLLAPLALLVALWFGKHPLSSLLRLVMGVWSNAMIVRWHAALRRSETLVSGLCRRRPRVLLVALAVSVLSWVAIIGEYWLMTHLLGLNLTLDQAILALIAARIAILLPVPAGLGTLEASQIIAMEFLGLPGAVGAGIGLLIRLRDILFGLFGLWIGGAGIWSLAVDPEGEPIHAATISDSQTKPSAHAAS